MLCDECNDQLAEEHLHRRALAREEDVNCIQHSLRKTFISTARGSLGLMDIDTAETVGLQVHGVLLFALVEMLP
jgi:hypothetical protein